jgi:hypothetical protein
MKCYLALLVLAVAANAHWTHDESLAAEIGAPPGKTMPGGAVNFIAEEAKATAEATVYRITVGTKQIEEDSADQPWSVHKFKVNIEGVGGQKTGEKELRYYAPTLSYSAASGGSSSMAPAFHPGMQATNCEPNTGECAKYLSNGDEPAYKGEPGLIQHGQIETSEEIGEIKTIVVGEVTDGLASDCSDCDGWQPSFLKINANDFKSGLGAGVYYIDPAGKEIRGNNVLEATVPDANGNVASGKIALKRCLAQFCEEEMDDKVGLEEDTKA